MNTAANVPQERILLIDDDELIASSLRNYLVAQGCLVDVAVDRDAADALMAATQYRVVVVDPYLTGGVHRDSGVLLQAISNLQPSASVFVLTGYESPALALAASACRVSAILTKPQSVVAVSELVNASFEGAQRLPMDVRREGLLQ